MFDDIEKNINTSPCKFSRKCLENFDTALCCTVQGTEEGLLIIEPVSSFKSSNCSYKREIRHDTGTTHICTCPVRRAIYNSLGR